MLEEAKLDDLCLLIAMLTGDEIHKLMQAQDAMNHNDIDEMERALKEENAIRMLRREYTKDFVGIKGATKEEYRRSGIGEAGCDLKHGFLSLCYNIECAQKMARMVAEAKNDNEKKRALQGAVLYLKGMEIFKNTVFDIRDRIREKMGIKDENGGESGSGSEAGG